MMTTNAMFATDEHDLREMVRELDELRCARGLNPSEPWWQQQATCPRRLGPWNLRRLRSVRRLRH